jgi:hypothetical protein
MLKKSTAKEVFERAGHISAEDQLIKVKTRSLLWPVTCRSRKQNQMFCDGFSV